MGVRGRVVAPKLDINFVGGETIAVFTGGVVLLERVGDMPPPGEGDGGVEKEEREKTETTSCHNVGLGGHVVDQDGWLLQI